MLKVNGVEIKEVICNGKSLDKVTCNGAVVFEKYPEQSCSMRTNNSTITLAVKTTTSSTCEVWNDGKKIAVLNGQKKEQEITIPNKNADIIIKGSNIVSLFCDNNQLTSLNVQGLSALQQLYCNGNQLTSLNVQGLSALQQLFCNGNQLTSLNVQGLTALQQLFCNGNQLTSLNVQGLSALQRFHGGNNQLTSLNVQGLTALQRFFCNGNQLTAQTFKNIFDNLPANNGKAVLYRDGDNNYKNFTYPPELAQAFNSAKSRGFSFYKNNTYSSNNLI